VSQPMDRSFNHEARGQIDHEAGEFWVGNPFRLVRAGNNLSAFEANRLFMNMGDLKFYDASFASGADIDSDSRSVMVADFDRDGAADILVASIGGGPLRLFLNRFPKTNHAVHVELRGTESNRPAIGSRVELHVGDRRIFRDVFSANGFQGQAPAELLIGIGSARRIDRMIVTWPTGKTQEFSDIPADRRIRIVEGAESYEALPLTSAGRANDSPPRR
jgi:hypothetical protein